MLLLLLACSTTPKDTGGGDTSAAEPTFTRVQDEIYTPSCAFSSCHGSAGPAQGLDLSEGTAYAATVDVPSTLDPTSVMVKAGDPDHSFLYRKCAADPTAAGSPMPDGSSTGLEAGQLALLHDWIAAGALDN